MLHTKRVYDSPRRSDGLRILVDRIWPRGLTKADAKLHAWMKELAPSTALRKWFNHEPARWVEFQKRYSQELAKQVDAVDELVTLARKRKVTLVFGAKDCERNQAVALERILRRRVG